MDALDTLRRVGRVITVFAVLPSAPPSALVTLHCNDTLVDDKEARGDANETDDQAQRQHARVLRASSASRRRSRQRRTLRTPACSFCAGLLAPAPTARQNQNRCGRGRAATDSGWACSPASVWAARRTCWAGDANGRGLRCKPSASRGRCRCARRGETLNGCGARRGALVACARRDRADHV